MGPWPEGLQASCRKHAHMLLELGLRRISAPATLDPGRSCGKPRSNLESKRRLTDRQTASMQCGHRFVNHTLQHACSAASGHSLCNPRCMTMNRAVPQSIGTRPVVDGCAVMHGGILRHRVACTRQPGMQLYCTRMSKVNIVTIAIITITTRRLPSPLPRAQQQGSGTKRSGSRIRPARQQPGPQGQACEGLSIDGPFEI